MALQQNNGPLPQGVRGEWNIYDANGVALVPFDTFFETSHNRESRVAEKPVERGGFVDYNKTVSPYRQVVRLGKTGNPTVLGEYLAALGKLIAGTDLVSIVTPEKTYLDVNATGLNYDRTTANGVDRILVELAFQEIHQVRGPILQRNTAQTENPAATGRQHGGPGQAARRGAETIRARPDQQKG